MRSWRPSRNRKWANSRVALLPWAPICNLPRRQRGTSTPARRSTTATAATAWPAVVVADTAAGNKAYAEKPGIEQSRQKHLQQ